MDRVSEMPRKLADCHELIRQLQQERAAALEQALDLQQQHADLQQQHADLQRQHEEQGRVLDDVTATCEELRQDNQALKDEISRWERWAFGQRRERSVDAAGQGHLFGPSIVLETDGPEDEPEQDPQPAATSRRRRRRPKFDLDRLPHKRIELDVPEDQKQCDPCGGEKVRIGEDVSRVLRMRPAEVWVEEYVRPKYACRDCKDGVVSPPPPERPLPRCIAGPEVLAWVVVSKYADHLPLYRQEDIFARYGLTLSRSTLCDWIQGCADLLLPLYELEKRLVLTSTVMWTDDTPVRLIDPEAKGGSRLAHFWTYITNAPPYTVYDFTTDRSRNGPQEFLKGWVGHLHADAFGGYDGVYLKSNGGVIEVACHAHARRKFVDARKGSPREAAQMLEFYRQLYDVEDRARELSDEERVALRQQESCPVLERMRAYLDGLEDVLPKSSLGQARTYFRNQFEALCRYTTDGRLTIDNNVSERTLRSVAIGRKNWLFIGHQDAGPRTAVLLSILASAKRHYIEPWAYLSDVFLRLGAGDSDLESLLPDRWAAAHPEHVLDHRIDEARQRRYSEKVRRETRRAHAAQAAAPQGVTEPQA